MDRVQWQRPIFILGNPRSGTSLLRLMLHSHSEICIPPESHFFLWLEDRYKEWNSNMLNNYIEDLFKSTKFETWNINREKLSTFLKEEHIDSYAKLNSLVYQFYASTHDSSKFTFWGDKNSLWIEKLDKIAFHYPNAFYIHIVRDGRDVACSYKSLNKKQFTSSYAPKLPNDVKSISKTWTKNIIAIDGFFNTNVDLENKITVRYEDLLRYPKKVLDKILKKLNLDIEDEQVEFYAKPKTDIEPNAFFEWKEKLQQPLDTNNIGKFKTELTDNDKNVFVVGAKFVLKKYGYI